MKMKDEMDRVQVFAAPTGGFFKDWEGKYANLKIRTFTK